MVQFLHLLTITKDPFQERLACGLVHAVTSPSRARLHLWAANAAGNRVSWQCRGLSVVLSARIRSITRQLASRSDAAHRAGVVHRDIKPSNAIWGPLGDLVLTDFGIAKSTLRELDQTQMGIICGTPAYLSPEQAQGLAGGPSSDIYALGVVLYELLAGRPPFEGATPMGVVLKHIQSAPPSLSATRQDLPPSVTVVVDRALAKELEVRFDSAGALASALEEAWDAGFADAPTLAMDTHERTTMLAPPIRIPQSVVLAEPAVLPAPPAATTALVASSRRYRAAWYAVPVVLVGLLLGGRGLVDRLAVPPPQLTTMSVLAAPVEHAHAQEFTGAPIFPRAREENPLWPSS